jgi:hypothetical protein
VLHSERDRLIRAGSRDADSRRASKDSLKRRHESEIKAQAHFEEELRAGSTTEGVAGRQFPPPVSSLDDRKRAAGSLTRESLLHPWRDVLDSSRHVSCRPI